VKLSAKDRAKLIPRLALRWSKLIAEDTNTEGFWEDVEQVLGASGFGESETNTIKGWVREWAARITRIFG
jgi:hypothetical protein